MQKELQNLQTIFTHRPASSGKNQLNQYLKTTKTELGSVNTLETAKQHFAEKQSVKVKFNASDEKNLAADSDRGKTNDDFLIINNETLNLKPG